MRVQESARGLVLLVSIYLVTGQAVGVVLFTEDFETGALAWVMESPWAITTENAHGGTHSLTDSPGTLYENNLDKSVTVPIDLSGSNRPLLSFWHRYDFQENADYGYVEVSADEGKTWTALFFITGNSETQWFREEIDLSSYFNRRIHLRFRITTDSSVNQDGWFVDDVEVSENNAVIPFPFLDDMETSASDANWVASSWRRIDGDGHDSDHCWARRWHGRGDMSTELVLRGTMDFRRATNPRLSFWHRGSWVGSVFASGDGGHTWAQIYQSWLPGEWGRAQLDLSPFCGVSGVLVKFVLGYDYWHLDDVLISDAPAKALLNPVSQVEEHSITLCWSESMDSDFASYRIYRSPNADMSGAQEIAMIVDRATTCYVDKDLIYAGRWYYYRVYVLDTEELWSDGSNIQSAETTVGTEVLQFPFIEDMESGDTWGNDLPWGLTDDDSHSGTYCWTDSPGTSYDNSVDRSLTTVVDLSGSERPLLSFWHRYNLEENRDYGYVEVSTDKGATWKALFFVTGYSATEWFKEEVDLRPYANSQIRLRFRIITDGSGTYDGWYIDDVEVSENNAATAVPFSDDAETSASEDNWIASSWRRIPTGGHNSPHCWARPSMASRGDDCVTELVLRGKLDLTAASNPQFSFWHRKSYCNASVHVSPDGGDSWNWVYGSYNPNEWSPVRVDLSPYVGLPEVLLKFVIAGGGDWYVDDVIVSDAPTSVSLDPISQVTEHSITLCWSPNTDSDFASYRIYRSVNSDMSGAQEIARITDWATTCYMDRDLIYAGRWYYYRVYVVDTQDLWSEGSYVRGAQTELGAHELAFPFADDMESGDTWGNDLPWGLTDVISHSGAYSWTDSPGKPYDNNMDRSLTTVVNLSGSNRPLLSFWHRYNLEKDKDYGYFEVSTDEGATWNSLFFVTGYSGAKWFKEEIDLSPYTGSRIRLRFRIITDASGKYDGWYVDDVELFENNATTTIPFLDGAETSASDSKWVPSSWRRIPTDGHDSAQCWAREGPAQCSPELVLRGTLDFRAVSKPRLSFWHHKTYGGNGQVSVSSDGGHTWNTVYTADSWSGWTEWRKVDVDLSAYEGRSNLAAKFVMPGANWYIDDVEIAGEIIRPPAALISVEGGIVTLSWAPFGDTGSYTIEWSEDLNAWTPELGMPISETTWAVGWIETYPKWRFWRVSATNQ